MMVHEGLSMKIRFAGALVVVACVALTQVGLQADEIKSGPGKNIGGAFNVKAITGELQGKTLCYVCKFGAEARPAVVLIFSNKADDNIAAVVKAVDGVQKNNAKLGTVLVGVGGVEASDLEKLQSTHKLTTPLTIAVDKNGPKAYDLNEKAAVTVLVYAKGGAISQSFGFTDTQSAAAKASDIAAAAKDVLK